MSVGRPITHHSVGIEELDTAYEIFALDKAEPQSKCYRINAVDSVRGHQSVSTFRIQFQEGDPRLVGLNGLTDEVLLAILIDRAPTISKEFAVALQAARVSLRHAVLERYQKKQE